jgi:hypothetical protein
VHICPEGGEGKQLTSPVRLSRFPLMLNRAVAVVTTFDLFVAVGRRDV